MSPQAASALAQPSQAVVLPAFDLNHVVERMKRLGNYKDWSDDQFATAILEYRRYVALCKLHPFEALVPGRQVDAVWHQHILYDTQQYMVDCDNFLGRYLHHRSHSRVEAPGTGPSKGWQLTLRYYEQAFGTTPDQSWLKGQADCDCND